MIHRNIDLSFLLPVAEATRSGDRAPFCRDSRGSTAVEFAFVGGFALFLLLATMQVGLYFYTSASLENATARAMRQVMTGATGSQSLTAAQFRTTVLCPLLPTGMSCSNVVTNIRTVPQGTYPNGFYQFVNSASSWIIPPTMDNTQTSFCTGSTGSVVYAQVYYAMPVLFPQVFGAAVSTWNGKSVFFIGSYAAFKNEPFQGSNNGSC